MSLGVLTLPSSRIIIVAALDALFLIRLRLVGVAFCALFFAGCLDEKEMIRKFTPRDDDQFARQFVELIRQARYDEAAPMLEPAVAEKAGADGLTQLHRIVDHGDPIGVELIGVNTGFFKPWDNSGSSRQANLVYQIQFPDAWVVATIVVRSNAQGRQIVSAFFQPVRDNLQELNRFTLSNKSPRHYVFLAGVILVPLFIIFAVIVCIRSRVRRRWLWIPFILIGFGQVRLDWTTGQWDVQPLSFSLLGAGGMRASSYAALVLTVSIPLGAIVFLILRRRLRGKDEPPPLPDPMAVAPPAG